MLVFPLQIRSARGIAPGCTPPCNTREVYLRDPVCSCASTRTGTRKALPGRGLPRGMIGVSWVGGVRHHGLAQRDPGTYRAAGATALAAGGCEAASPNAGRP